MSNPLIQEINVETGNSEVREMTNKEFADFKKSQEIIALDIENLNNKVLAKAALLEKLGITEDEAKLLLS